MKPFFLRHWRLIAFVTLLFAMLAAAYWWIYIPWNIYEHGDPAHATVLDVWDTGSLVNDEPLIGLRLAVQPEGSPPFEIEKNCRYDVTNDWFFHPGAEAEARVAFVPPAQQPPAPPDAAARLESLETLLQRRLISEEEYQELRQEILDAI